MDSGHTFVRDIAQTRSLCHDGRRLTLGNVHALVEWRVDGGWGSIA
jgi:hypothetical protein